MTETREATACEAAQIIQAVRSYEPVQVCPAGSLDRIRSACRARGAGMWRVGEHYGIHVYEGDKPIATFHTVLDAEMAVDAYNNRTLVEISEQVVARCAEAVAIGDDATRWQIARAVIASLVDQGITFAGTTSQMHLPTCDKHHPIQHRDSKEPWCNRCGLTIDFREPTGLLYR